MILRTRTWQGGSTYEVTASPDQLVDRLPLPGEEIELGDMGRVRVMSARDASQAGREAHWVMPDERLWHLVVQTPGVGPSFPNQLSELVQKRVELAGRGLISEENAERIGRACIAAAVDIDTAIATLREKIRGIDVEAITAELDAFAARTPTE